MVKDPIFFTPEVDHSMNIINETDKEEHSRMRRMLSFAFSNANLLENEDILTRRTDEFVHQIGHLQSPDGKRGINIVRQFNYVTFDIMGMYIICQSGSSLITLVKGKCLSVIRSMRDWQRNQVCRFPCGSEVSFSSWIAEYRYHWADVIVNTTYMNDVMRAVRVIPGLFSFLEWYKTDHMKKTLYRHAEYATEHTEA